MLALPEISYWTKKVDTAVVGTFPVTTPLFATLLGQGDRDRLIALTFLSGAGLGPIVEHLMAGKLFARWRFWGALDFGLCFGQAIDFT